MSLTRRLAALAIALAATHACGGTTPKPAAAPAPPPAPTRVPSAQISGTITTPDGRPLTSAAVVIRPLSDKGAAAVTQDAELRPDGQFTFHNVAPGPYLLRASATTRGAEREPLFAAMTVEVVAADVTGLDLVLRPGGGISGRVTVEPEAAVRNSLTGTRVRAPLAEANGIDEAVGGDVAADGTFEIRGLPAGGRYLTVEGLPSGLVLKRIEYRRQDITNLVIDVGPGDLFRELQVVVTDRASEVNGTVRNDRGEPVQRALVVVLPASPGIWTRANRRLRLVRTDDHGRYRIRGLPPGEYRAFASSELDEDDVYGGDSVEPLIAAAAPLAIADDTIRTLDLPLTIPSRRMSSGR